MKISYAGLASITGAALLAACGSDVANSSGSGSGAGGGSTSVTTTGGQTTGSTGTASTGSVASSNSSTGSITSTGVGGGATGCPPALPSEGSPCTGAQIGLICEYGDDPRPYCRDFASCDTFEGVEPTWVLKVADCPPIAPVADCPMIPDSTENDPCMTEGAICLYPDGAQCGCSSCGGGPCGMDPLWWCSKAPEVGCPTSAPNTGQPCVDSGLVCAYGTCAAGTIMQRFCAAGIWQDEPVACPE